MTIGELIEQLKKYDPNIRVITSGVDEEDGFRDPDMYLTDVILEDIGGKDDDLRDWMNKGIRHGTVIKALIITYAIPEILQGT